MKITLDLTLEEILNDLCWKEGMETWESCEYIKDNFDSIINNEIESLLESIGSNWHNQANVINDNRWELWITNDNGKEIWCIGYYAEVSL